MLKIKRPAAVSARWMTSAESLFCFGAYSFRHFSVWANFRSRDSSLSCSELAGTSACSNVYSILAVFVSVEMTFGKELANFEKSVGVEMVLSEASKELVPDAAWDTHGLIT